MDRFDDIWKNRFNEQDLPDSDWISPDNKVWEGILKEVDTPKKEKRRFLIWWISGFALIILTALWLFMEQPMIENSTKKINQTALENSTLTVTRKDEEKDIEDQATITGTATQTEIQAEQPSQLANKRTERVLQKNANVSQQKTSKNLTQLTSIESSDAVSATDLETIHELVNGLHAIDQNAEEVIPEMPTVKDLTVSRRSNHFASKKSVGKGISQLPSLNLTSLLAPERNEEAWPFQIVPLPTIVAPPKRWRLGFHLGAVHWKHRITDRFREDFAAFDFNYTDTWGWQATMDLAIPINSWLEWSTGIQYEAVQNTSGHNSPLDYRLDREDGSASNAYALSLATPYGLAPAEFSFKREQDLTNEEVDLLVDFQSKHTLRNFSVPVGFSIYPLGQRKRIIPKLNVGIGVNYIAGMANEIDFIQTHHDAILLAKETAVVMEQDFEKWHLDYRLGLGVQVHLSQHLRLDLGYNWVRGINPVFKLDEYSTHIDRHLLSVGLSRSFY